MNLLPFPSLVGVYKSTFTILDLMYSTDGELATLSAIFL